MDNQGGGRARNKRTRWVKYLYVFIKNKEIALTTDYDAIFKTNFSYSLQVFLFIGATFSFFIKTPVYFFFNIWLLKAHVESPLVGSIVLAAIVFKLSLYGECLLAILVKIQLSNNKINRSTTIIISKFLYTFNYNYVAIPGSVHSAPPRANINYP